MSSALETTGVIESMNSKHGTNARGPWEKKSIMVNGQWFSTFVGKENRSELDALKEGDAVKVFYQVKGDFKNMSGVEIVARNEPAPRSKVVNNPVVIDNNSASVPYNVQDKDYRITYLASRRDAITLVETMVKLEMLKLPTKQGDKADSFLEYVRKYARILAEDAYAPRSTEEEGIEEVETEKEEVE